MKSIVDTISVIIPTFNRAHSLPETIQSVVDQSASNWELIIVDDGSTDNTKDVIEFFLSDKRVKYYFQQNAGVSAARNKGIELCHGDYVIFLDSDDRFFPGLFSKLNEVGYSHYDIICWQVLKKIDGKYLVWRPKKLEKIYNNVTATFLAGSICFKKKILIELGGFDPEISFGENYELGLRISGRENLAIKIIDQQFLFYAIDNSNRQSNTLVTRLESYQHLYNKHHKIYLKDRKSHGHIKYMLGYVCEQLDMIAEAKKHYQSSFITDPLNYKALLKIIYFKLFHR